MKIRRALIALATLTLWGCQSNPPVTYLVDLPQPAAVRQEPAAPAQPAQQLGPPEGRGWVYWAENVSR